MSLVNDMLNDLEKRSPVVAPDIHNQLGEQNGLSITTSKIPTFSTVALIFSIIMIVVMAVAIVWLYQKLQHDVVVEKKSESIAEAIVENKVQEASLTNKKINDKNNEKWLSDIRFTKKIDSTIVHLSVDKNISYDISRNSEGLIIELIDVIAHLENKLIDAVYPVTAVHVDEINTVTEVTLTITGKFNHEVLGWVDDDSGITVKITPVDKNPKIKPENANKVVENKNNPNAVVAQNKIKPIKKVIALSQDQKDKHASQQASRLLAKGRFKDAEILLNDILRKQTIAPRSAQTLASLLLSQGKIEQAQSILTHSRKINAQDPRLLAIQARLYLLEGKIKQSIELLVSASPDIRSHTDYYELLAQSAQRNKQFLLSEKTYRSLIEVDVSRGDWWVGLAVSLDAQGLTLQAKRAYKKALKSARVTGALKEYAQQRLSAL